MKGIAMEIKRKREILNFSQNYMANELGISQPAYVKIENGSTKITVKRLLRIAHILQTQPHELLRGLGNNKKPEDDTKRSVLEKEWKESEGVYEKLIKQLETENRRLRQENERLWKMLEARKP